MDFGRRFYFCGVIISIRILQFVGANLAESTGDFGDALVKKLQDSVAHIKADREMGERYMLFEELLKDEFSAGKAESVEDFETELDNLMK